MTFHDLPRRPRRPVHPLTHLLRSAGIRQADAAPALGVSRAWLCAVLAGLRQPSADLAKRLDDMTAALRDESEQVVDHGRA